MPHPAGRPVGADDPTGVEALLPARLLRSTAVFPSRATNSVFHSTSTARAASASISSRSVWSWGSTTGVAAVSATDSGNSLAGRPRW